MFDDNLDGEGKVLRGEMDGESPESKMRKHDGSVNATPATQNAECMKIEQVDTVVKAELTDTSSSSFDSVTDPLHGKVEAGFKAPRAVDGNSDGNSGDASNNAEAPNPLPRFLIYPHKVQMMDHLSSGGARDCAAVIRGRIDYHSPSVRYILVAYLLDAEDLGTKVEVERLLLDSMISVSSMPRSGDPEAINESKSINHSSCYVMDDSKLPVSPYRQARFKVMVNGLQLGKEYGFDLVGEFGEQRFSYSKQDQTRGTPERRLQSTVRTPSMVPSAPHRLTCVGRSKTGVKIRWQKPRCDGGSTVQGYTVQRYDPVPGDPLNESHIDEGRPFRDVYAGSERCLQINKLRPGQMLLLRVCANNNEGASPWCDILRVTSMPSVPDSPGAPYFRDGIQSAAQLDLRWDPPPRLNGLPVSNYCLEMHQIDPSSAALRDSQNLQRQPSVEFHIVYSGLENECIISNGISPAMTYRLRVRAESAAGVSQFSPVVELSTIGMAPAAPAAPVASYSADAPPPDPTPSPRRKPRRGRSDTDRSNNTCASDGNEWGCTNCTFVNLPLHLTCSMCGAIRESKTKKETCDMALPDSAQNDEDNDTRVRVLVSWSAPGQTNGSAIKQYALECRKISGQPGEDLQDFFAAAKTKLLYDRQKSSGLSSIDDDPDAFSVVYSGIERHCNLTTLLPGEQYSFRVLAQNGSGWSDPSHETALLIDALPPTAMLRAPKVISVDAGTRSARVKWDRADAITLRGAKAMGFVLWARRQISFDLAEREPPTGLGNAGVKAGLPNEMLALTEKEWAIQEAEMEERFAVGSVSKGEVSAKRDAINPVLGASYEYFAHETQSMYVVKVLEVHGGGTQLDADDKLDSRDCWCTVQFTEHSEVITEVPASMLLVRLRQGDSCLAVNYSGKSSSSAIEDAVVSGVTETGYWIKFPDQLQAVQETRVADVVRVTSHVDNASSSASSGKSTDGSVKSNCASVGGGTFGGRLSSTAKPLNDRASVGSRSDTGYSSAEGGGSAAARSSSYGTGSKASIGNAALVEDDWTEVFITSDPRETECTVSGLRPGVCYELRVAACNTCGVGAAGPLLSDLKASDRPPSRPGRPRLVAIDGCMVELSLRRPSCMFGCALDSWQVAVADARLVENKRARRYAAVLTSYYKVVEAKFPSLESAALKLARPARAFAVRVRACSVGGRSHWSRPVGILTEPGEPDVPLNVRLDFEAGLVCWAPPGTDGGSPILNYLVEIEAVGPRPRRSTSIESSSSPRSPRSAGGSTGQRAKGPIHEESIRVAALEQSVAIRAFDPGTEVKVCVRARNECGAGAFCNYVIGRVPATVPHCIAHAPEQVACGQSWVKLKWSAPIDDGGQDILGYDVEIFRVVESRRPPSAVFADLAADKNLDVHAQATRELQNLQASAICSVGNDTSKGSGGVVTYFPSPSCRAQVKGLDSDAWYVMRVCAVNGIGAGTFSPWRVISSGVSSSLPAPQGLCAVSVEPLRFEWEEYDNSRQVQYRLQLSSMPLASSKQPPPFAFVYTGSKPFFTLPDPRAGSTYRARVSAIVGDGASRATSPFSAICTARTPGVFVDTSASGPQSSFDNAQHNLKQRSRRQVKNVGSSIPLVNPKVAIKRRKNAWGNKYASKLFLVAGWFAICFGTMVLVILYYRIFGKRPVLFPRE